MKIALIVATLMFSIASQSHARVGETMLEITARFGLGQTTDKQRLEGAQTYKFSKNGFQVEVVISQGKSIWEIYQKQNVAGTFPSNDIEQLLEGYKEAKENKRSWRFDRRENRWESTGKPKLIAYLWPSHEDFFCIKDEAACEALEKKSPGSKGL